MKMNGGSSAPYPACTPCVPLFCGFLIGVETEVLLDHQERAGIVSFVWWNLRPVIFGVNLPSATKHFLPEKALLELFFDYRYPIEIFELILENYSIPIACVSVV